MLKFPGRRPQTLGVNGRLFKCPPTWKPNWVSSQVAPADAHYIAPLHSGGDAMDALRRLKALLQDSERVVIVDEQPGYLHAEFSSKGLGFTDDVEFCADGDTLHVRSSSRLGIRDFGVNRARVEALRSRLQG